MGPGVSPCEVLQTNIPNKASGEQLHAVSSKVTHLVILGGATTAVNTSFGCPGAPIDLLYLLLFLGEGGCGRPREKVALLLAGRTESFLGLMGGGGGWGRDTLGLRFLRLSSIDCSYFRPSAKKRKSRCNHILKTGEQPDEGGAKISAAAALDPVYAHFGMLGLSAS